MGHRRPRCRNEPDANTWHAIARLATTNPDNEPEPDPYLIAEKSKLALLDVTVVVAPIRIAVTQARLIVRWGTTPYFIALGDP